jgi:hypothetical protein
VLRHEQISPTLPDRLERDRPEHQRARGMALLPVRNSGATSRRETVLTEGQGISNTSSSLGLRPRKQRGSILEGQGGLALIVEHRLPPPAVRRKPLPIQLGLFGNYSRYRQLELWR